MLCNYSDQSLLDFGLDPVPIIQSPAATTAVPATVSATTIAGAAPAATQQEVQQTAVQPPQVADQQAVSESVAKDSTVAVGDVEAAPPQHTSTQGTIAFSVNVLLRCCRFMELFYGIVIIF